MKLLHTSDWHLGQSFMGKSRIEEHEAFLSWLLTILKEQNIEVLLISGDIFDTGTPPNYALELYYNFLKQLSTIKSLKTTIVTAGNPDSVSTLKVPKNSKLYQAYVKESFIVSLPLALGLSSLVSQKISIDSIFLDEGFGTLDSDSLELALNALNQLQSSGKMVGVIPHV